MRRFSIKQLLIAAFALVLVGVSASAPVLAESLVQASEDLSSVPADKVVDGTAFVAGDTVTVAGMVKGDLFCAGNSVTITGTVEGDVLCAGNNLTINGTVNGDIRVAGNTIILKGYVGGSATVAGNSISSDNTFSLGQDLTVGGNTISLDGIIGRDVRVGSSEMTLVGAVGRNIDGSVEALTVAAGAKVGGNVTYTSDKDGAITEGAVAGNVTRQQPDTKSETVTKNASFAGLMAFLFFITLLFVVFSLFIVLVAPRYVRSAAEGYNSPQSFLKAAVVGIATFFVVLPVAIMAFLSGVGALIGVFVLTAYSVALMLSGVLVAYRLGAFMVNGRTVNAFALVAIGSVALTVLVALPFIGLLAAFVAGSVGLGMVMLSFASQYTGRPYSGNVVPELVTPIVATKKPVAKKTATKKTK